MAERTKDCLNQQIHPPIAQFFGRTQYPNSGQPAIGCQKGEQIAQLADLEHDLMFNESYSVGGCAKRPATDEIKSGVSGSISGDVVPFANGVQRNGDQRLEMTYSRDVSDLMCSQARQFQSNLEGFELPSAALSACAAPAQQAPSGNASAGNASAGNASA